MTSQSQTAHRRPLQPDGRESSSKKVSSASRKATSCGRLGLVACCAYIGEKEDQEGGPDFNAPKSHPGGAGSSGNNNNSSGVAVWGQIYVDIPATMTMKSYESIRKKCLSTGELYKDPTFPPNASTLYRDGPIGQVVWKRPKELTSRPYLFHDDAMYFDMDQGILGDCWFVASAVCLAASPHRQLLFRVVPQDQGFESDYCGAFRFNIWQYGKWVEVVVDDLLPTVNGRLIYGSNRSQPNEFWCPLLEKAYAKVHGSYNAINGGFMDEGLVDLTAGIGEALALGFTDTDTIEKMIKSAHNMNSIIGATINLKTPKPGMREVKKDNGLFQGHAYSVINVKEVKTGRKKVTLLHLRNPWGRGEWTGPWSDRSDEWKSLSAEDRKATFRKRDDGEFWMEMKDFVENFDFVCMAHLTPDAHSREIADNLHLTQWNMAEYSGAWVRGKSSGGPLRSFTSASFWTNPQFKLSLPPSSDHTTVIISLFELNTPAVRSMGDVSIGYVVFQMNKGDQPHRIDEENYYEFTPRLVATSKGFTVHREITRRFKMAPSDHVIVPCTQRKGQQAEFYLRIFSDKKIDAKPFDPSNGIKPDPAPVVGTTTNDKEEPKMKTKLEKEFDKLAGDLNAIDANDFVSLLDHTGDPKDASLNIETCRCLISAATVKSSKGLATIKETKEILEQIKLIKNVFKLVDNNNSNSLDKEELETLLNILEYYTNDKIIATIWKRYGGKRGRLSLEDFIQTCCKLIVLSRSHEKQDYLVKSYIKWQEWVQIGFA